MWVWINERGQEGFFNFWPGQLYEWVMKHRVHSVLGSNKSPHASHLLSIWMPVVYQAQHWTLGVQRWFRFCSCPHEMFTWSMRDGYVQWMHIFQKSISWTQFKGAMAVIAPTSGRNPGVIPNFSLTKSFCVLWQFAISSLLLIFYNSHKSGISLPSDHINGISFPI